MQRSHKAFASWRSTLILGAAAGVLTSTVSAQGGGGVSSVGARMRIQPTAAGTGNNTCRQLMSAPTMLGATPSGFALLRMQHELSAIDALYAARRDSARFHIEARKVEEMRRNVDSLVRVAANRNGGVKTGEPYRVAIEGPATREAFEVMIRALEPKVAQLSRSADVIIKTSFRNAPVVGWMGVRASASNVVTTVNGHDVTSYCEYPVVESVDPGSPAEVGGVFTGDTLLAYNGRDLLDTDVEYSQLLVPGQTVRVRLRRTGGERELPIAITPRPDRKFVMFSSAPQSAPQCEADETRATCEMRLRNFRQTDSILQLRGGSTGAAKPRGFPSMAQRGSASMRGGFLMPSTTGVTYLYGARLSEVSEEFAKNAGTEPGVYVLDVLAGPMHQAGIRPGERITAVNGNDVRDIVTVQKAFAPGGERTVKLQIASRSAAPRTVIIRY